MSSGDSPWLDDVSRETIDKLEVYVALLEKWNPVVNLVSARSLSDVWERHIRDSLQLYVLAPKDNRTLADLGSGGGFPGLPLAILASEINPALTVTLVESDQRKAAFLSAAVRELGLGAKVIPNRVELVSPLGAHVITARALAPLSVLMGFAKRHLAPSGKALFLKGATWQREVDDARRSWGFELAVHPSQTDGAGRILEVMEIVDAA